MATSMCARPHKLQARALSRLNEQLANSGRAVVVMPCGSGKTFLGRWLAEQLRAQVTVVFVPSIPLVPQTVLAYRSQTSWQHSSMVVCSDATSGRSVALADLDLPVWARSAVTASTSSRAIGGFLRGPGPKVIVSTYHSAPKVAAALTAARITADLVVCDETHRLTGRPRGEFRAVLDDRALPARRRVFLTATPVEAAAWEADHGTDDNPALYLDDEHTFGPTVLRASFADAVAEGLLVDYDVEVLACRDGERGQADPVSAVLTAARDGASRILTFHTRISSARAMARALHGTVLPGGRTVRAEHLEARHRSDHRGRVLGDLSGCPAGEVRVVCSARVLTEGVDVPAVDTVVFAEPKTSAVDIVQAVGRAMRTCPGKTRGRIVLTVTLDRDDLDADTELADTRWRHVWVVLRALATMDPRFAQTLRACTWRNAPGAGGWRPGTGPGLNITLPDGLDVERWLLRALDRTGASWWHNLDVLRSWASEHGHAHPSHHVQHHGVAIGSWVGRQRTMHKDGLLQADQVAALESLPGWAWTKLDTAWWQAWTRWIAYHETPGRPKGRVERWVALAGQVAHSRNPKPRLAYDTLAEFAAGTCALRRRGELPRHLERAADRLPEWSWDLLPRDDAAMVDALAEYAAWKGDLNPPHGYCHDDGLPLGAWLTAVRRRRYTGRLDTLLELELSMLSSSRSSAVGLRWEPRETGWRLGYLALRQYQAREGTCRVPYQHTEALPDCELNLSRWCVVQRQTYRRGKLEPERVVALEQVPGWQWEVELRPGYRPVLDDAIHGTRTAYVKGCKCDPCTAANASYNHARDNGGRTDLVDAGKARGHVRLLLGRGAEQKSLARAADLNVKTIVEVADGTLTRIRPETETAILALTLDAARTAALPGRWGGTVPAGPTWELINDMLGRGWPKAWISREIGQDGRALQLKKTEVSVGSAQAVVDLHRRLGKRVPPPRQWRAALPTLAEILDSERRAG